MLLGNAKKNVEEVIEEHKNAVVLEFSAEYQVPIFTNIKEVNAKALQEFKEN